MNQSKKLLGDFLWDELTILHSLKYILKREKYNPV